MNKVHMDMISF